MAQGVCLGFLIMYTDLRLSMPSVRLRINATNAIARPCFAITLITGAFLRAVVFGIGCALGWPIVGVVGLKAD
jgi:hypothetical protein